MQRVIDDLALFLSEESVLVQEALRFAAPTITKDLKNLPAEITGQLLPFYATHSNIRSLIRQCDTDGLYHCGLVPNFPYAQVMQNVVWCDSRILVLRVLIIEEFIIHLVIF